MPRVEPTVSITLLELTEEVPQRGAADITRRIRPRPPLRLVVYN